MAALRRSARGFTAGSGAALGLAAYVIESGLRSEPSLPRLAAYAGAGLVLGTVGSPLLMRAKYRIDRPLLAGKTSLWLHRT